MNQDFAIDPGFSVYHLMGRLQTLNMLRHRRTMSLVSYEIENATLIEGARNRIFSGFQVMSKFLPQVKRYRRLAAQAEHVYVFGVPDMATPPIPNLTYVPLLPTDQLAREWFLVSSGPRYESALATEEVTRIDDPDHLRVFKGAWTFDPDMVGILRDWLTSTVDAPPLTLPDERDYRGQMQIMTRGMARLTARIAAEEAKLRAKPADWVEAPPMATEGKAIVEQEYQPALQRIKAWLGLA